MSLNASLCRQDSSGRLLVAVAGQDNPAGFNGGTPLTADGRLANSVGLPTFYVAGLGYDALGNLCRGTTGPIAGYTSGGLPYSSGGRLFIETTAAVAYTSNGIPLAINGGVACASAQSPAVNIFTKTEAFDDVYWTKTGVTITANAIASPNSATTADRLAETAVSSGHSVARGSIAMVLDLPYSVSIFAKADTRDILTIDLGPNTIAGGASSHVCFDLTNGVLQNAGVFGSPSMEYYGNGWWRCKWANVVCILSGNATATFYMQQTFGISTALLTYLGELGKGLYLWGAQLEQSDTVGPYKLVA